MFGVSSTLPQKVLRASRDSVSQFWVLKYPTSRAQKAVTRAHTSTAIGFVSPQLSLYKAIKFDFQVGFE